MSTKDRVEELIRRCRDSSPTTQCSAIADLEDLDAKEAVPVLVELLDSPFHEVRANAVYSLGRMANLDVGAEVMKLLIDNDSLVRLNAVEALGYLSYTQGLLGIIEVLKTDDDPLVRLQAAETLGMLDDVTALCALTDALYDSDDHVRAYAADSIARLQARNALPALQSRLAAETSPFAKAFLLSSIYRLGCDNVLNDLFGLATMTDDTLAVTILNLVVDFANVRDVSIIKSKMGDLSQSRPSLMIEIQSLMGRLDALANVK